MILEEILVPESQLQEGRVFLSEVVQAASGEEFNSTGMRVDLVVGGREKFRRG